MRFYWLTLGVLGVWRITHLLTAEDGPWELVVRLRRRAGKGGGVWGALLDCFNCLSLWVALPVALTLGDGWRERLLLWPAISGAAILLGRLSEREEAAPIQPAPFMEDEDDVMLRR
jgi:hypothetical protein